MPHCWGAQMAGAGDAPDGQTPDFLVLSCIVAVARHGPMGGHPVACSPQLRRQGRHIAHGQVGRVALGGTSVLSARTTPQVVRRRTSIE